MADHVHVAVYARGGCCFTTVADFPRVPSHGEYVFLALTTSQAHSLGTDYGDGDGDWTAAMVRDVALYPAGEEYAANLYVEAVTNTDWTAKLAHFGSSGDTL